jgi:hypothetical protein
MRTTMTSPMRDYTATPFGTRSTREMVARTAATVLGIVFIALGIAGLVSPGFMGMHLGMTHTLIHLVSGAISLYLGLFGSAAAARLVCLVIGGIYAVLTIAGFAFGGHSGGAMTGMTHGPDAYLLRLVPGYLELGLRDHILHAVIGTLYLASGLFASSGDDEERSR